MKKIIQILVLMALVTSPMLPAVPARAQVPIIDVIKEVAKKVIRAIDLQVQRLQNKTIALQNIQKELENIFSKLKLNEISDWTQKQKDLYKDYFDELWRVKTIIAYYKKVLSIVDRQKAMVAEYRRMFQLLRTDRNFTAREVQYMYEVYNGIIEKSLESIQQILTIIESFGLQMSDADRLQMLDKYNNEIDQYYTDLRSFTNRNISISLSRTTSQNDLESIRRLYGLPPAPSR